MPTFSYNVNLSIGGVNIARGVPRSGDHPNPYEITLPAGKAGTLSTRTDNDTGVATVASGHGITTSDLVDVYWSGGMRYGMSVTATTSTTISVDAGAGDNFPVAATAIVVTKQVSVNTAIDGDSIQVIGILAEYATNPSPAVMSHVHFQSSAPATIAEIDLTSNVPQVWDIAGGATNPFTGNPIVVCKASNGSGTDAATLKIVSLEDSTP